MTHWLALGVFTYGIFSMPEQLYDRVKEWVPCLIMLAAFIIWRL